MKTNVAFQFTPNQFLKIKVKAVGVQFLFA